MGFENKKTRPKPKSGSARVRIFKKFRHKKAYIPKTSCKIPKNVL